MHWSDTGVVWKMNRCSRSYPEPGWSIGREWSRQLVDLDLWLVLRGRGWMQYDAQRIELRRGVAIVARPGSTFEAEQDLDDRLCVDAIHFDLLDSRGERLPTFALPPRVMSVPDLVLAEAVSRRLRERPYLRPRTHLATDDPVARALLRGLLLDLEDHTLDETPTGASSETHLHRVMVQHALTMIHESFREPLRVADLAQAMGYSADHFGRIFRSITGQTPQAAMIQARLDRARHLLKATPMSIAQIAESLGYSDVFFFSRQFKKFVGASPSQFRRSGLSKSH